MRKVKMRRETTGRELRERYFYCSDQLVVQTEMSFSREEHKVLCIFREQTLQISTHPQLKESE